MMSSFIQLKLIRSCTFYDLLFFYLLLFLLLGLETKTKLGSFLVTWLICMKRLDFYEL